MRYLHNERMYSNVILETNYTRRERIINLMNVFPHDVTLSSLKEGCEELYLATSDNSLRTRPGVLSQIKDSELRKLAMVKEGCYIYHIVHTLYIRKPCSFLFALLCSAHVFHFQGQRVLSAVPAITSPFLLGYRRKKKEGQKFFQKSHPIYFTCISQAVLVARGPGKGRLLARSSLQGQS